MGIPKIDENINITIEYKLQDELTLDSTAEEVRIATPEARKEWAKAMAKRSNELITEEDMEQLRELVAQRQRNVQYQDKMRLV